MTLFIVGGNRKHEDEPLRSLILHLKKLNLNLENAKQKRALHTGQGIKINNAKK